MIFLIDYDRRQGKVITFKKFRDSERKVADAFRIELELRLKEEGIEREVVLLMASSEKVLRQSYRHYFETLEEIAKTPFKNEK